MKTSLISLFTIITLTFLISCKRENEEQNFVDEQTARNEQEILSYIATKGLQMQKDANGIYYQITGLPAGESPDTTFRYVELKYEIRLIPSEKPIDTNYSLKGTKTLIAPVINPTTGNAIINPKGMDLFMQLNKQVIYKGQKATLLMNHTQGFGTASTPFLPPYSALRIDLEVVNVKAEEQYISEKMQMMGLVATQNLDGIIYSRTQSGVGEDVTKDSSRVTVKFIGKRVIDNTIFDSSESFQFRPYEAGNILGWRKGIPLIKKVGEKGYLFMPSRLAYGPSGRLGIGPFTPLYFEVEILNVNNE
ncbi:MAG: FKBP-type peptidyl-prolyl cis-trans isomerase [Raineya sp.]|nr:FKBP-type peptidyl-prolyl cis-trans isomerase [Raineya sp.]